MHTAELLENSSTLDSKKFKYLGEIETEFENILACLSGAQMGLNHEKNWRLKISWHTPFKQSLSDWTEDSGSQREKNIFQFCKAELY